MNILTKPILEVLRWRFIALSGMVLWILSQSATAQDNSVTIGSTQLKEDAVLWLVPSGNSGQQGLILPVTAKEGFTPSEKGMVIYDPSDDKVYYWNGTDWLDLVGSGSTSLNSISDLPDVDASGVATGQVLKWNGSTWVPSSDEAGGGGVGSDDQQLTFDEGTKILSIENGNGVDLSSLLSGGGADNWGTQVVEKDNSLEGDGTAGSPMGLASQGAASGQVLKWNGSGWVPANDDGGTAGATYSAGDGINIDGANVISNSGDADADPTNELQSLSFNSGTNELSLTDGNTVTIPSGGTDADADPTNEIQDISLSGTNLSISDGSTIDLSPIVPPGGSDDQNLVLTGDVLTIENGTGSVDLAAYGNDADADPTNEIDVTVQTGLLVGDGSAVSGLNGTADGQVPKWDAGSGSWVAGTDQTGGGGSSVWTENGNDIHYDAGNVGIGRIAPAYPIDVLTSSGASLNLESSSTNNYMRFSNANGYRGYAGIWTGDDDMDFGTGFGNTNGKVHLTTSTTPRLTVAADGKVGVGTTAPKSTLDIQGGNWNVGTTEGDLRIGNDTYRLKMGVALGGVGAGDARIRAQGGTDRLLLGAGSQDVLSITPGSVNMVGDFANQSMYQVNPIPGGWVPPSSASGTQVDFPGASLSLDVPVGSKVLIGFSSMGRIDSDNIKLLLYRDTELIKWFSQNCYEISGSRDTWHFNLNQLDNIVSPGVHTYKIVIEHSDDAEDCSWSGGTATTFYALIIKE